MFCGGKGTIFLSYGVMELWRMRLCDYAGIEASTSLPFMKIVTLRVLDFAITDVLAKLAQMLVTLQDEENRSRRFCLRLCCLDVRDNDWSDILFVRKDLAESVPSAQREEKYFSIACITFCFYGVSCSVIFPVFLFVCLSFPVL